MESKTVGLCDRIGNYLTDLDKWHTWRNIMLGQFLSVLLSIQTILCHFMTDETGMFATGQALPHYLLLFVIYTTWLGCSGRLISGMKARGCRYLLVGLLDVEANALVTAAHPFTAIASIQLLGCVGIPVVLVLTWLVLGVRYRMVHIVAISICLLGVGCLVWADTADHKADGKNQLMGDMLCLSGAVLVTVVTVLQELSVKTTDVIEYLGFLGLFGTAITLTQMLLLEKQTFFGDSWRDVIPLFLLAIYGTIQFIFVSLGSLMIQNTSAITLHLSLLSSNYYTSIIGALLLGLKVHALYFMSYVLMVTGVFIFSIKSAPIAMQLTRNTQQRTSNNNRALIDGQDHSNSIGSDGTVELLSNLSAFNYERDNINNATQMEHSISSDTTFTSFYGTNVNHF